MEKAREVAMAWVEMPAGRRLMVATKLGYAKRRGLAVRSVGWQNDVMEKARDDRPELFCRVVLAARAAKTKVEAVRAVEAVLEAV